MKALNCLTKECIILLHKNKLLQPLIKSELVQEVIESIHLEDNVKNESIKTFREKLNLQDENVLKEFLIKNNLSIDQFNNLSFQKNKLKQFYSENFKGKIESRFLQRKDELDIIVYSLLRVSDLYFAKELYLRVSGNEADFGDLAQQYSEGLEKNSRGIIGPGPIGKMNPKLADALRNSKPGEILPPININNQHVIARVEYFEPAQLDDFMKEKMGEELFNIFIDNQVSEISLKLLNTNQEK
tara:strand:- start:177 stop:902 length:726 start_codon:yes stop_codon:yes gene_type:complete